MLSHYESALSYREAEIENNDVTRQLLVYGQQSQKLNSIIEDLEKQLKTSEKDKEQLEKELANLKEQLAVKQKNATQ